MIQKVFIDGIKTDVSQGSEITKENIHRKRKASPNLKIESSIIAKCTWQGKYSCFMESSSFPPLVGLFFAIIIDDHSKYCWIYDIKSKEDVFSPFRKWISIVERQTGRRLDGNYSNNGGEYLSTEMTEVNDFMTKRGTLQRLTVLRNRQQNVISGSLNWTLYDLVCSMLYQQKLGREFWNEPLKVAAYVCNWVTTKGIQ